MADAPLVLGSSSPRRRALLEAMGVEFVVRTVDLDERPLWTADVHRSAQRSAQAKFEALAALASSEQGRANVVTADTMVAAAGRVLGKPDDRDDARRMLGDVSGETVTIVTALCLGGPDRATTTMTVATEVVLRAIEPGEIDAYLATTTVLDKAGALELQGAARDFVERVDGCWSNVVGLPVCAIGSWLDLDGSGRTRSEWCSGLWCGTGDG